MKDWKEAIESLGFQRCCYEKKEHLHCMAFRKISELTDSCNLSEGGMSKNLYIPQDFNTKLPSESSNDEPNSPPTKRKKAVWELPTYHISFQMTCESVTAVWFYCGASHKNIYRNTSANSLFGPSDLIEPYFINHRFCSYSQVLCLWKKKITWCISRNLDPIGVAWPTKGRFFP